jgi:3-oxoacyl-[acyl-carrier protein] reductase
MTGRLAGRTAVITGVGSGMGRSIAERFAAEGAHVIGLEVNETALNETVSSIQSSGGSASGHTVDISSSESVDAAVTALLDANPSVDILVNNAGILDGYATLADTDEKLWDRIIGIDLKGMFLMTRALMPTLQQSEHGAVVNTASIASMVAQGGGIAYTSAKHGVIGFTKAVAYDAGPKVRVNAVLPGAIETGMTKDIFANGDPALLSVVSGVPAGRYAQPEEVANAVLFLASDEASFMYGSQVVVDGGWTIV